MSRRLTLLGASGQMASGPTLNDIILLKYAPDTAITLSNGNHTVTLNTNEPGFNSTVPYLSKSLGATDKAYWQIQSSVNGGNAGQGSGMLDGSFNFASYDPSSSLHAYLFQHNGARYHNGSVSGGEFGWAAGTLPLLACWDGTRLAFYLYVSTYGPPTNWGGGGPSFDDDPKTGTGGFICTDLTLPATPFITTGNTGDVMTINGGERAFDSSLLTEIAALRAAGFVSLAEI